jgi:uncharacterized protein
LKTFVDTLFVAVLINPRDQYHSSAVSLAAVYESTPLVTTDVVLLEIGNTFSRHHKADAIVVVRHFLSSANVQVLRLTPALFDRAFALYASRQDKDWGLSDCVSFIVMQDEGVTDALTFDQHFVQAGFRALMRPDM